MTKLDSFFIPLVIVSCMFCTVTANLLLKKGAMKPGLSAIWPLSIINGEIILGGITFATAFLFYIMTLKKLPLNLAQAIFSIQFILVIVAAGLFLGEPISAMRWGGIMLTALGIVIVIFN